MEKILIVDDEAAIRMLQEQILTDEGYHCVLADNAAHARETLHQDSPPDLVLSDIDMPGESGIDFIGFVLNRYPSTAAVMVSVIDDPHIADAALRMGVYGYLVKPFHPKSLLIEVKNALHRRRLERENQAYQKELEQKISERTEELRAINRSLRQEIAGRIRVEEQLKNSEAQLLKKSLHLEEVNSALKVLLKQREDDRKDLENSVLSNVREFILPYIEKIKEHCEDTQTAAMIDIAENNLNNIISPFSNRISNLFQELTPMEVKITNLIKDGKTAKEIAHIFGLSPYTVIFHRSNIRDKLGLRNRKVNLVSYLRSLEK